MSARSSVDSERARYARSVTFMTQGRFEDVQGRTEETFMINTEDITALDRGFLPDQLFPSSGANRYSGAFANSYACDAHALSVHPITAVERAAHASLYTHLTLQQWVLEQRRLKAVHGQEIVEFDTHAGATTLATGKSGTTFDDEISLLVDLGSSINIIGLKEANRFMEIARRHGLDLDVMTLNRVLYVNGVGAGSAVCRTLGRFHIACNYLHRGDEDAGPPAAGPPAPQRDQYVANIAEGSGEDLPAILGLKSMQSKDAIIVLKKGSER